MMLMTPSEPTIASQTHESKHIAIKQPPSGDWIAIAKTISGSDDPDLVRVAVRQVQLGDSSAAAATISTLSDPGSKAGTVLEVVSALTKKGGIKMARDTLAPLIKYAQNLKDESLKTLLLRDIAHAQWEFGDERIAIETLRDSLTSAPQADKPILLIDLGLMYAVLKGPPSGWGASMQQATAEFLQAIQLAEGLSDRDSKVQALRYIGLTECKTGNPVTGRRTIRRALLIASKRSDQSRAEVDFEGFGHADGSFDPKFALDNGSIIDSAALRSAYLSGVAKSLAESGHFKSALAITDRIGKGYRWDLVECISLAEASQNRADEAEQLANTMPNDLPKLTVLSYVLAARARSKDKNELSRVLRQLSDVGKQVPTEYPGAGGGEGLIQAESSRELMLNYICSLAAQLGEIKIATDSCIRPTKSLDAETLIDLARTQARGGMETESAASLDAARKQASAISDLTRRAEVLRTISEVEVEQGNSANALSWSRVQSPAIARAYALMGVLDGMSWVAAGRRPKVEPLKVPADENRCVRLPPVQDSSEWRFSWSPPF